MKIKLYNKMKYWYIVLPISMLICTIAIYMNNTFPSSDLSKYQEYKIIKEQTKLNGVVVKIEHITSNSLINLNNCEKFWINPLYNLTYNPPDFYDFIQINDSVYKKENDDTLFICRGNKKYFFIINFYKNSKR